MKGKVYGVLSVILGVALILVEKYQIFNTRYVFGSTDINIGWILVVLGVLVFGTSFLPQKKKCSDNDKDKPSCCCGS